MKHTLKAILVITTLLLLMIPLKVNAQSITINTETLMLRKEASTDSSILELLSEGEKYEVIGEEGNWYKIKTKENTGYVNKDYVVANGAENQVTTTQITNETEEENNNLQEDNTASNEENTVTSQSTQQEPKQEKTAELEGKMRVSQDTTLRILPLVQAIELENLKADTEIFVITTCNKWAYVETQVQTGWVRIDMLAQIGNEQNISNYENETPNSEGEQSEEPDNSIKEMNQKGYISGTGVNVRSIASTQGEVVEVLNINAEVTVIAQEGEWYKIRYSDIEGYVLAKFVSDKEIEVTSRGSNTNRDEVFEQAENISTVSSTVASKGEEIVAYAKQYLGKPYVYGASGPNSFDCSGFTMYVYQHFGISMSHSAIAQSKLGKDVSKENLQLGDLVFFEDYETKSGIGHVGIYIGNGEFIHASSGSGYCVKISTLLSGSYNNRYMFAKRLID